MKKWVFVTYRYPYVCCRRRTKIGAKFHSVLGHFEPGKVMRHSEWVKTLPRPYRWMER